MSDKHFLEVDLIEGAPQGFKRIDLGPDHSTFLIGREKVHVRRDSPKPVVSVIQPVQYDGGFGVLIAKRAVEPIGIWTLPAGHIEKTETAMVAGARELYEETGIFAGAADMSFLTTSPGSNGDVFMVYVQHHVVIGLSELRGLSPTAELSEFEVFHDGSSPIHFKNCTDVATAWCQHHANRRIIDKQAGKIFL
jgi:8-oxo-dGTP pyrophosphatase MutT (NUDIX family)